MLFPAEFEFIFPFNFCTDLRFTSNPCQIYMHIAGSLCDTRFPHTFYGEKIWSVVVALFSFSLNIALCFHQETCLGTIQVLRKHNFGLFSPHPPTL